MFSLSSALCQAYLRIILADIRRNYACLRRTPPGPEIVTDGPDVTESTVIVLRDSFQFENDVTWATPHGDQWGEFFGNSGSIRLFTRAEPRLVMPNYLEDITGA